MLPLNATLSPKLIKYVGMVNINKESNQISPKARDTFVNFVLSRPMGILANLESQIDDMVSKDNSNDHRQFLAEISNLRENMVHP